MKIKSSTFYFLVVLSLITFYGTNVKAADNEIVLDGLYATSIKIPYAQFAPEKAFDGNENTAWETMPGTGMSEGLMMYFEKPSKVEYVEIKISKNSAPVTLVDVFVDGAKLSSAKPDKGKLKIYVGKEITAFYIKIAGVEKKSNKSAGISEVIFEGKTVVPLKTIVGQVQASSTLKPTDAYHTDFLFDSNPDFGWVEGQAGNGTGATLKFSFSQPVTIKKIKIWNGYQRSLQHYMANERVAKFSFAGKSYPIKDDYEPQEISITNAEKANSYLFKIEDIYKGDTYQDTVISELRFFDGKSWFRIESGLTEVRKTNLLNKIKGTVLEKVVDEPFNGFILRSNGTFVYWQDARLADGNWELKTISADKAEIRIFGKDTKMTYVWAPYDQGETIEQTNIFQETLTVTPGKILGGKIVGEINFN